MGRTLKTGLAALVALVAAPLAMADNVRAETIVIGVPAWPSAEVTAHVFGQILTERLGAATELKEQGTLSILAGIDKGTVHVHPEIWSPNLAAASARFSKERGTLVLNDNPVTASQNICTTRFTHETTGLAKVADLANPEMAAHFDTDKDGKGEMWIGAPTWSSTNIELVRAKSYGFDQTMTLLEGQEDVAMAGVDVAVSFRRPIVFFCYQPHHLFQLHDIVVLEEPPHDPDQWTIVSPADDIDWLKKSAAPTAWAPASYRIGYSAALEKAAPQVAGFLGAVAFTAEDAVWMSYQVQVERRAPDEVAKSWIADNQTRIEAWLAADQ